MLFSWENPLFQWPFSIAMLNYQRVDRNTGWWFGTWILFFHILGMSSPQLTNSYFSEGLTPPTRICGCMMGHGWMMDIYWWWSMVVSSCFIHILDVEEYWDDDPLFFEAHLWDGLKTSRYRIQNWMIFHCQLPLPISKYLVEIHKDFGGQSSWRSVNQNSRIYTQHRRISLNLFVSPGCFFGHLRSQSLDSQLASPQAGAP